MFPIPKSVFLTRGAGVHRHRLSAFEYALRDADIEQQNLVSVSSILPAQCQVIERHVGTGALRPGEITFCVIARAETNEPGRWITAGIGLARPKDTAHYGYISETNEPGRWITAGIGLARPKDTAHYGYISEHHGFGMTEAGTAEYVEDLAATMLASTLGIEFDPDAAWDERKRVYEMSDLMVDTHSIVAAAHGASNGDWTCVVASAVFLFSPPSSEAR